MFFLAVIFSIGVGSGWMANEVINPDESKVFYCEKTKGEPDSCYEKVEEAPKVQKGS